MLKLNRKHEKAQFEEEAVRMFAERNGWQYEGRKLLGSPLLPNQVLAAAQTQQIYRISGAIRDQVFDMTAAGKQTVLRTQSPISTTLIADGTQTLSDSGWNYVVMPDVAASVAAMKAMLQPLLGAPSA